MQCLCIFVYSNLHGSATLNKDFKFDQTQLILPCTMQQLRFMELGSKLHVLFKIFLYYFLEEQYSNCSINEVVMVLLDIYLFKVSNRNTRNRCEICSTLTIRTTKPYFTPFSSVSIVDILEVNIQWDLVNCVLPNSFHWCHGILQTFLQRYEFGFCISLVRV